MKARTASTQVDLIQCMRDAAKWYEPRRPMALVAGRQAALVITRYRLGDSATDEEINDYMASRYNPETDCYLFTSDTDKAG